MRLIDGDALAKVLNDFWLATSPREHDDKETALERAAMCRGIDDCIKHVHDSPTIGDKTPGGLTSIGYNYIIDQVVNRKVQPPEEMYTMELSAWLTGYAKCQNDIIDIINKLKDQYGR